MPHGPKHTAPVIIFECKGKDEAEQESIPGEDEPYAMPVLDAVDGKMVYYPAAAHSTKERSESISHDHEQSLGTGPDGNGGLFFDEERTGNIEEVEGHSIDDHGEDEEGKPGAGVADTKEAKAKNPGENAHQHYFFDTETIEEKRNGEDEQGLGDLGHRGKEVRMFDGERIGIVAGKVADKGQSECVGDLQGGAQEHSEQKEYSHFPLFEQYKSIQAQGRGQRFLLGGFYGSTCRHGECIDSQQDTGAGAHI